MRKQTVKRKKSSKPRVLKFPYKVEFCPNPDCIQIHARSRFPKQNDMDTIDLKLSSQRPFRKEGEKRHPLYKALAKIKGLQTASGGSYHLQITKANSLFNWDALLPKVLAAVQSTVAGKRRMTEIGKTVQNPPPPTVPENELLGTPTIH